MTTATETLALARLALSKTSGAPGTRLLSAFIALRYNSDEGHARIKYEEFQEKLSFASPTVTTNLRLLEEQGVWKQEVTPEDKRMRVQVPLFLENSENIAPRSAPHAKQLLTILNRAFNETTGPSSPRLLSVIAALNFDVKKGYALLKSRDTSSQGVSERAHGKAMKELEEQGLWEIERIPFKGSFFRLKDGGSNAA